MLGLNKEEIMKHLSKTEISVNDQEIICTLILANNKEIEKNVPEVVAKKTISEMNRKGFRI